MLVAVFALEVVWAASLSADDESPVVAPVPVAVVAPIPESARILRPFEPIWERQRTEIKSMRLNAYLCYLETPDLNGTVSPEACERFVERIARLDLAELSFEGLQQIARELDLPINRGELRVVQEGINVRQERTAELWGPDNPMIDVYANGIGVSRLPQQTRAQIDINTRPIYGILMLHLLRLVPERDSVGNVPDIHHLAYVGNENGVATFREIARREGSTVRSHATIYEDSGALRSYVVQDDERSRFIWQLHPQTHENDIVFPRVVIQYSQRKDGVWILRLVYVRDVKFNVAIDPDEFKVAVNPHDLILDHRQSGQDLGRPTIPRVGHADALYVADHRENFIEQPRRAVSERMISVFATMFQRRNAAFEWPQAVRIGFVAVAVLGSSYLAYRQAKRLRSRGWLRWTRTRRILRSLIPPFLRSRNSAVSVALSDFSRSLTVETAFTVLAVAKALKASGKDVVELEIGDSPFDSTASAKADGIQAIEANQSHYCPSPGLPEFREAAAKFVKTEFNIPAEAKNIVVGPGAKIFEQFFCEAFLNPNDGVLVFSPYFPTYIPNILRRGARPVLSALKQSNEFRPEISEIEKFLANDPSPKAIFLNSPQNPTGGVTTEQDLRDIADLIRGKNIAVFSDEPYCHMVWRGKHHSLLAQPGMLEQSVAAYTFSKSYSMSGWRLGFAVASAEVADAIAKMINTTLSCTPTLVQLAGKAALERDSKERDSVMQLFREKVELLTNGLNKIDGFHTLDPTATFYVFPNVAAVCNKLGITSHGLALYLLEGADDNFGVACLGGECFGESGRGFLRFSCAEPNERLQQALDFLPKAIAQTDRVAKYLESHPQHRLQGQYALPQ